MRRIFPALLLVLIFCVISGWLFLFQSEYESLGRHIAAAGGFVSNFLLWGEVNYFDVSAEYKPLLHLWSLGIEEQFYIYFPILVFIIWGLKKHRFLILSLFLLFSLMLNLIYINGNPVATFYVGGRREGELLAGGLIAYSMLWNKSDGGGHENVNIRKLSLCFGFFNNEVKSILGFALVLYAIIFIEKNAAYPGWWTLLPVVGATLIILAVQCKKIYR